MDNASPSHQQTNNLPSNDNIVIIQLNVNSIRSIDKRHQLDLFMNQHKPHILLCTETHLNERHK